MPISYYKTFKYKANKVSKNYKTKYTKLLSITRVFIVNVPYRRVAYMPKLPTFAKTLPQHPYYTNASLTTLLRRVKGILDIAYALGS